MKVLILTHYGHPGASSRMRFYQYLPWLDAAGIEATVATIFRCLCSRLQRGQKNLREIIIAYPQRLQVLLNTQSLDLVWIEKETLPWLPAWVERTLLPKRIPYVLDYDDAVFHYYDQHCNSSVRSLLGNKHPTLMRGAALVMAGSEYLANFAKQSGAKHVEVVPTVIDLERYHSPEQNLIPDKSITPCVGWIGQHSTAPFFAHYKQLFERHLSTDLARFAAIGIDTSALDLPMESTPWSEQTEADLIASFDISIMPWQTSRSSAANGATSSFSVHGL